MARFFIDHPVFAMVVAIVIVILGAAAIPNLPVAAYPEVVPPVVQISTSYLGGNAQESCMILVARIHAGDHTDAQHA